MGVISITTLHTLSLPTISSTVSLSKSPTFTLTTPINSNSTSKSVLSSSVSMASSTLPAFSSSTAGDSNVKLEAATSAIVSENDLLIVGPGVLGRLVATKWKEEHPDCQIYGQTITTDHHEELVHMEITPCVKETKPVCLFPYVIFCAPPYPSPDYTSDIKEAVSSWNGKGCFLFTSSSAPYDCSDNGYCDESTPSVPIGRSPRTDVLLKAEQVVLENDGCVVRLAGLYTADRGAHVYWLQKGVVEARPDHVLNLIHYEDAASLAVTILKKNIRGRVFLGCDNHPLSRQQIMDLVARVASSARNSRLLQARVTHWGRS